MNQGRIWCVVHPTVGLPLLLGSVALTSLAVHTAIMTHTTWMSNYWQGAKGRVAMLGTTATQTATKDGAYSVTVTPVPGNAAAPASFTITVGPAAPTVTQATEKTAPPAIAVPIHTASAD
jgi:light-harvesting protein B-800-850 alpha chain